MFLKFIKITLLIFISTSLNAEQINIFEFSEDELKTIKVKKVRNAKAKTIYTVGKNKKGNYLKAEANNAASGLGKELKIDLNVTPILNITWKVEKDLSGINEETKKGHDFAARVFVIKKTGATPLSNRAINYVFSSNNDIDHNHPNPYTNKSVDYVLSTTKKNLNEWVTVSANVKEHFKEFHNLDVNELNGVAIMADTDNSKLYSISYYQNIYFSSE
tara:strand:- start:1210 stop:1860 length:651 start_codon:yes stop_codon:yes gene_type:complete